MLLFLDENKLQEVRSGRDVMIKRSNWVQMISLFDTRERPKKRQSVTLALSYLNDLNAYSSLFLKFGNLVP